ncbi:hypothetical protein JCM12856_04530 [Spirochaeta dissipatitropha]
MFPGIPIIDSEASWKLRWDAYILLMVLIATILAPLSIALDLKSRGILLVLDVIITISFIADMVIIFHTAYVDNRKTVRDKKLIARRYCRGWFLADLIASFPFFLLPGGTFLNLNRLARFARLFRILRLFSRNSSINRLKQSKFNSNVVRLAVMIFWLLLVAHFLACGFVFVQGVSPDLPPGMRYLQALYWTITTLSTVGYGDITPDVYNQVHLLFTIMSQLLGVGMYGYVIGNISTVIANIDTAKTLYREKMERINTFLKYRHIPSGLSNRINDYYDYLWETRRGYDERSVVDELPYSLRVQVVLELHREIISKVPIFAGASQAFIREIILNMESVVFTPGDYVVRKGEIGDEMYFISRGSVDVVSEDESIVYATLNEGAFFGEIALLLSTPRNATIKAREYCDLYSLNKITFERILDKYPDFAESIRALAEQRKLETEAAARKKSE